MTRTRVIAASVAALLMTALVAVVPARAGTASLEPVIVGLESAAAASLRPGSEVAGLPVLRVDRRAAFAVVQAPDVAWAQRALSAHRGVRYVEADTPVRTLEVPDDERYGAQYGPPMMGAETAWDLAGFGSQAVTVAVLDTGIRRTHEDFEASRVLPGHDYIASDSDPNDDCGHGTHVAGTVAATTDNHVGVAGMSQATILPYKVLGALGGVVRARCSGSTSGVATAIRDAADAGAHVISMSLGGGSHSLTMQEAIDHAWSKGVFVVAASGNGGSDDGVDYPGAYDNSIAVGSLTQSKQRSSFSDGGPQLDVVAPGSSVLSTYDSNDSSYSSLSGTSMATPHVSGAIALALSCLKPGLTSNDVRDALYSTAEDLGDPGFDHAFGHGLVRADRLVEAVCELHAPRARFESIHDELTVTFDASSSSDPDDDPLTYAWDFGDGTTASGEVVSHTFAHVGPTTVTLTVSDGALTDVEERQVMVATHDDPDPTTPDLASGQPVRIELTGTGDEAYFEITVPDGASSVTFDVHAPDCLTFLCSVDADIETLKGARPTDYRWACRGASIGSTEQCSHYRDVVGRWYVRVHSFDGAGTVELVGSYS